MSALFIDSHAHLDGPEFAGDLDAVLARAADAGVSHMICIGASDGVAANQRTLDLADRHPHIFATVGVHPHDADIVDDAVMGELRRLADHPKVVAIGETGLDFFYDSSDRGRQLDAFHRFLALAREVDKPVIVHTRDADPETIEVLRGEAARGLVGVVHCFTGGAELARAAVDVGWYVSFSGILTFRNAAPLREIARGLPHDRVLVETDCPYLAPIPHRGKRNEPAFVVHTAACLAGLWDRPEAEVRAETARNAAALFRLPIAGG